MPVRQGNKAPGAPPPTDTGAATSSNDDKKAAGSSDPKPTEGTPQDTVSGVDLFVGKIPKKGSTSTRKRRRSVRSPSSSSSSSSEDVPSSSEEDEPRSKKHKSSEPRSDDESSFALFTRGELPFTGSGSISKPLKKIAKEQKKKWDQLPIKCMHKMLASLETQLMREHRDAAADNVHAVRAVIEHLHFASCESSGIASTLDDAAKDVMQFAIKHNTTAQGCPVLWTIITKHLLNKVAELSQKVDGRQAATSPPSANSHATSSFKKKDTRKRWCRNCLVAKPQQHVQHSLRECQAAGNTCNVDCTLCGAGRHWESTCSRVSFTG